MAYLISDRILKHISDHRYVPRQIWQLAQELAIKADECEPFRKAIENMVDEGRVVLDASQTIKLPPLGRKMIGNFRLNKLGFGFVCPESPTEHGDLYVSQGNTAGALTGDVVSAKVIHVERRAGRGRSPYIGLITEILQRAEQRFVGNLTRRGVRGSNWIVEVDGSVPVSQGTIIVRDPQVKGAQAGDKVVVELIVYPVVRSDGATELAEGVVVEVLGKHGQVDVETLAVMRAHGLDDQFPDPVLEQTRNITKSFKARPDGREDFRDRCVFTIDPPDARDFDDGINIDQLEGEADNAAYELGVHIADVSHFVPGGSILDEEARVRGNSVYLPGKVVPMLPELLSNGLCSLQEGVDRYCISALIRFDREGQVVGQRVARTIIRSLKRLTYREAQALIDGELDQARQHSRSEPNYSHELRQSVELTDQLARTIRQRRLSQAMIVLDLPEVELVFDREGKVTDAVPEDDSFTHTIIEMFMVEANEAVARLFNDLNVLILRRIHADPPTHDMQDLRQFARVAGYNIPQHPTRLELQTLLEAVRGKPTQRAVHLAVLRTLSRAEYAPLLIGHFALASEHYAHFTSPIRRYPDLLVHRALAAYLDHSERLGHGGGHHRHDLAEAVRADARVPDDQTLSELGRHCSQTERNGEAAERDLTKYLVLELLSQCLGEDFDGTVTGVTNAGLFIQLDRFLVDGFVHVSDLPAADGRWRLNRNTGALVARSGHSITIGDRFTVRVVKANPTARRLDLFIVDKRSEKKLPKPKRRQPVGARKALQTTMKMKRQKKSK